MASYGISSGLGIAGVILIVIGIIMAIVGIILLIVNQNQPKAWYIWFLLIGGVLIGIVGGILLAVALSQVPAPVMVKTVDHCGEEVHYVQPAPQVQYVHMAPQPAVQYVAAPQYVQMPSPAPSPGRVITRSADLVGPEHLDPDPKTYERVVPQSPRRVTAVGPYGPNGEIEQVTGVYTPPAIRERETVDIVNHPVTTGAPVAAVAPRYAVAPAGYVAAPAGYVAAPAGYVAAPAGYVQVPGPAPAGYVQVPGPAPGGVYYR